MQHKDISTTDSTLSLYIGDINYKKPRLTKSAISHVLSSMSDPFLKLNYLEQIYQTIKHNKDGNGQDLYNKARSNEKGKLLYVTTNNEGQFTNSQMRDIWLLKLAYLEICLDISNANNKENNDRLASMTRTDDSLLDFDMADWRSPNRQMINARQAFDSIIEGKQENVTAFLKQNDQVQMNFLRAELHWDIARAMEIIGYKTNAEGVCLGLCGMAQQAMSVDDFETFETRLDFLFGIPSSELMKLAENIRDNQQNGIPLDNKQVDLMAFFDGIKLYIKPEHHPEVFPENERPYSQDILASETVVRSVALENKGGLEQIQPSMRQFQARQSSKISDAGGHFFASFAYMLEKAKLSNQSVGMILDLPGHSVFVGYDAKNQLWNYFDINCLPIKKTSDTNELAAFLLESYRHLCYSNLKTPPRHQLNAPSFSPMLFVPKDSANDFKNAVQAWFDFWYQGKNAGDLVTLLKSVDEEDRLHFLTEQIGVGNVKSSLSNESFPSSFIHNLKKILDVLPEEQAQYFMENFINKDWVAYLFRSNIEKAINPLNEKQKDIFIHVFNLKKNLAPYPEKESSVNPEETKRDASADNQASQTQHTHKTAPIRVPAKSAGSDPISFFKSALTNLWPSKKTNTNADPTPNNKPSQRK